MAMSTDERIEVANAWADAVKKTNQQLIIQVGGTNLPDVKKLVKKINLLIIFCIINGRFSKPNFSFYRLDMLKK